MNIVGIGTDIIEVVRIAKMIEKHDELFLNRVFTSREIQYCAARASANQHFAGRWAAKEAVLKALGTGWAKGIHWTDMEIRHEDGGQPFIVLHGAAKQVATNLEIVEIKISISHCRAFATAVAIAVGV